MSLADRRKTIFFQQSAFDFFYLQRTHRPSQRACRGYKLEPEFFVGPKQNVSDQDQRFSKYWRDSKFYEIIRIDLLFYFYLNMQYLDCRHLNKKLF